jgi:streptomycin 6-kinase
VLSRDGALHGEVVHGEVVHGASWLNADGKG